MLSVVWNRCSALGQRAEQGPIEGVGMGVPYQNSLPWQPVSQESPDPSDYEPRGTLASRDDLCLTEYSIP